MKKKNIIPYVALCGLLLFNPLKARAGIGIEKKIGILWLNGETSRNSQKVDSIAEDINGNKFVYGYNKLGLIYGDVLLIYRIPITKSTSLDIGTGVASTLIQI